jgi:GNAT superfamily N-acetyltransferase
VVCFFIDSKVRRQGFTLGLLEAAVEYARSQGAAAVEGYPWPGGSSYLYMGTSSTFRKAGFREVVAPAPRPVR